MNSLFKEFFGEDHLEEYVSGVFSDELDLMGLRSQVAFPFQVNNPRHRLFGRCRTLLLETKETDDENIDLGLGFLGSLGEGDVLVVEGSSEFAYFGELMTRLSCEVGIAGVVIDGLTRDHFYTATSELPVLCKGYTSVDIKGRGRVSAVDVPIKIDGIDVRPNDLVFADTDSAAFIPAEHMSELKERVARTILDEADIKRRIAAGESVKEILSAHRSF